MSLLDSFPIVWAVVCLSFVGYMIFDLMRFNREMRKEEQRHAQWLKDYERDRRLRYDLAAETNAERHDRLFAQKMQRRQLRRVK